MKTITRLFQPTPRPDCLFAAGAKSTVCALFAAALLLAGCGKDDAEPNATLTISPVVETISFSAADDKSYTFTVITEQPAWTAVSDQAWCRVAMDAEAKTFTVTAQPNDGTTAPAPATITVTAGKAAPLTITATQAGARYDVYVIGETSAHNACYWKNGELFPLEGPDKTKKVKLFSICIDDHSVYFGGDYNEKGCYWKDGEMVFLEQPKNTTSSSCSEIAVSDGKVLCVGASWQERERYFCYWVDNALSKSFSDRNERSGGYDLAVYDGTVYFLGDFIEENKSTVWYMKEGDADPVVLEPLTGYNKSEVTAIAVSEGKVYVAGWCLNDAGGNYTTIGGYWVDGVFMPLENPATGVVMYTDAIIVENGTVHVTGLLENENDWSAFYWNNKQGHTPLSLPEGAQEQSEGRGMAICDGKLFISGYYSLDNESIACYWIDGKRFDLPDPDGDYAYARSLAVMKR